MFPPMIGRVVLMGGSHVYASFGGLLLHIEGPHKRLSSLRHEYIYLLMKK